MERLILVGLDASPNAATVLNAALDVARRDEARLVVIRAVTLPIEFPPEALSISPDALPARLVAITQRNLDAALAAVPKALIDRAEARLGTTWRVLCDAAKDLGVELVVIGTHGHHAIDRLLGTTAARVVDHAPCSVLVVRNRAAS